VGEPRTSTWPEDLAWNWKGRRRPVAADIAAFLARSLTGAPWSTLKTELDTTARGAWAEIAHRRDANPRLARAIAEIEAALTAAAAPTTGRPAMPNGDDVPALTSS
jgi:hypothetical protein